MGARFKDERVRGWEGEECHGVGWEGREGG